MTVDDSCGICGGQKFEHVMASGPEPESNWYGWLCKECGAHKDLYSAIPDEKRVLVPKKLRSEGN